MKFRFEMKKLSGIVGGYRFNDEIAITDGSGFVLMVVMFATKGETPIIGCYRYREGRMRPSHFIENENNNELEMFVINHIHEVPDDFIEL